MAVLINNGPDIPDELLHAHEEGRVVFFCGSGISVPAGLPLFNGLVKRIHEEVGVQCPDSENAQLDSVLHSLEKTFVGGRVEVRKTLPKILAPNYNRNYAKVMHKSLLQLAKDKKNNLRIVTTNFYRIFENELKQLKIKTNKYVAPLLPVPKESRWNGIVYLHGLLAEQPSDADLENLVLSSGDFGLAYLLERWAARFVSELFRNYVVCFVGYSVNDPILRYMVDALAADELRGEKQTQVYAFSSFSAKKDNTQALVEKSWKDKNITPILYEAKRKNHKLLYDTFSKWGNVYSSGVDGKKQMVLEALQGKPAAWSKAVPEVGRMLWALRDKSIAKFFAELDPPPPFEWFEAFIAEQFDYTDLPSFGVTLSEQEYASEKEKAEQAKQKKAQSESNKALEFSFFNRPSPSLLAPRMGLFKRPYWDNNFDDVMLHLTKWLFKHMNEPKLLLWFCQQYATVHDIFLADIQQILVPSERNQNGTAMQIAPRMRSLWELLLAKRIKGNSYSQKYNMYNWCDKIQKQGLTPILRMELKKILEPCVVLREPWGLSLKRDASGSTPIAKKSMHQLVNGEITLRGEYIGTAFSIKKASGSNIEKYWNNSLPDLLLDFTALLHDVFRLASILEQADSESDLSYIHRPSITEDSQNKNYQSWTILVDFTRDAWLATAKVDPRKAHYVAEEWWRTPYPMFKRLAFFAATHSNIIPQEQAVEWLLTDDWLWHPGTKREVCRLLVSLAPRLKKPEQKKLEQSILLGPPRKLFREDLSDTEWEDISNHASWLRLAKLQSEGMKLELSEQKFQELSTKYSKWKLSEPKIDAAKRNGSDNDEFTDDESEKEEFPYWSGGVRRMPLTLLPRTMPELVDYLRNDENSTSRLGQTDWPAICKDNMRIAIRALRFLAKENIWPQEYWGQAFDAWSKASSTPKSWKHIKYLLEKFPDTVATASEEFIRSIIYPFGRWLEAVAKILDKQDEGLFFKLCQRVLEKEYSDEANTNDTNPANQAINHYVGSITEALLAYWQRTAPEKDQGLNEPFKEIFTSLCDTANSKFLHGRVLLVMRASMLFNVDESWTRENLIPLFDWKNKEAIAVWRTFLRWGNRFRPFLLAIKTEILEIGQQHDKLGSGEVEEEYAYFLTFIGLQLKDMFTSKELEKLKAVFSQFTPKHLATSIDSLEQFLEAATDKEKYWESTLQPFVHNYLPKNTELKTPEVSQAVASLCINAGAAFPQVLKDMKSWLQPFMAGSVLYQMSGAEPNSPASEESATSEPTLCEQFPEDSLAFLDKIVENRDNVQWYEKYLSKCLKNIEGARPQLITDQRFTRLSNLLN